MRTISITNWSDNVNFDPGYTKHVHNHLTQILQFNSKMFWVEEEVTVQEQMFFLHWKTRDGPDEKASFSVTLGEDTNSDTETV